MKSVSHMGFYRFKSFVFSVVVFAAGCAWVPSVSFAGQKDDCASVGCSDTTVQKDGDLEKIRQKAQQGDANAQMALGLRYLMGNGLAADEVLAQEWFLKSAQQNNVVAQVALATMLAFESDRQDLPAAAMWFQRAADAGKRSGDVGAGTSLRDGQWCDTRYGESRRMASPRKNAQ